jgi:hypothetical protein
MAEAAASQQSFVDTHVHVNFIMKQYNEAVVCGNLSTEGLWTHFCYFSG